MEAARTSLPRLLAEAHAALPAPRQSDEGFSVEAYLAGLGAGANVERREDLERLERLAKKIEVPRRLCSVYTRDLDRALDRAPVRDAFVPFLCAVYLRLAIERHDLKFLNTCLKLLSGVLKHFQGTFPEDFRRIADAAVDDLVHVAGSDPGTAPADRAGAGRSPAGAPRVIDLAVLGEEDAPSLRAYLVYLAAAGLRPTRLLLIERYGGIRRLPALQRVVGRRIAGRLVAKLRMFQSRRRVAPEHRGQSRSIQSGLPHQIDYFGRFDLTRYVESVERVAVEDLADPALLRRLAADPCRAFLYAATGLVPATLLQHDDVRLIHTHPGIVPDIKGADALLWSLALRGTPGASCFYMSAGIDTGEIIATREFEAPRFELPRSLKGSPTLYSILLPAFDRYLRADLFVGVVRRAVDAGEDLARLPSVPQDPDEGRTYFFMHEKLRNRILDGMVRWVDA